MVTIVPISHVPVNVGVLSVRMLPLPGVRIVGVRGIMVSVIVIVKFSS